MRNRRIRIGLLAALTVSLTGASLAFASVSGHGKPHFEHGGHSAAFTASLVGGYETPSIHTAGQGTFSLMMSGNGTISYSLSYWNLSSTATQAHIHFGQPATAGGVAVWLCGGGGKPACPAGNGSTPVTVTGTFGAGDVQAIAAQGLAAGDLTGLLQEMAAGFTYANVHTTTWPMGEIRGQLDGGHGHDDRDRD
jgi:hypothetical protein